MDSHKRHCRGLAARRFFSYSVSQKRFPKKIGEEKGREML
jgi:hypothetical protein